MRLFKHGDDVATEVPTQTVPHLAETLGDASPNIAVQRFEPVSSQSVTFLEGDDVATEEPTQTVPHLAETLGDAYPSIAVQRFEPLFPRSR